MHAMTHCILGPVKLMFSKKCPVFFPEHSEVGGTYVIIMNAGSVIEK